MAISNAQIMAVIKKNPLGTIAAIVVLAVIVALYFRSDLKGEAEADLKQKSAQGDRIATNIKNAALLNDQLDTIKGANQEISGRLVQAGQLAGNLQYFYKLEADTGTKLIDLRQLGILPIKGKNAIKTLYVPVNFAVSVQGSFAQLINFLQHLEDGGHFCRIENANFTPTAGAAVSGVGADKPGRADMLTMTLSLDLLGTP